MTGMRLLPFVSLLLTAPLAAQDSVIVIDPDQPLVDTLPRGGPPADAVDALVTAYNDSATTRLQGDVTIPAGTRIEGRVAMYRGTLRIAGTIVGDVVVANGTLVLAAGAEIRGDILVIGGRLIRDPSAVHLGTERVYWDAAPVVRAADGTLAVRERRRDLGDLATARASFEIGKVRTTLLLATDGTYNRIEGLPIQFGPQFEYRFSRNALARVDLRGLLRTVGGEANLRSEFGYRATGELQFGMPRRVGVGARLQSVIQPIEDHPLSRSEVGWSSFLLQRDYRDYYERQGVGGFVYAYPTEALRVEASIQRDAERSARASDPWSLLRNSDRWRANPLIDDGHYVTLGLDLQYDTRNERDFPTSGWYATARFEHGTSDDVAPVVLPTTVRAPIPTDGSYAYDRLSLDVRRYSRLTPSLRVHARLLAEGWIGGDPLPIQRRLSLGGPGLLPGYGFRAFTCEPSGFVDPARAGLCDRLIVAQIEFRTRLGLNLGFRTPDAVPGPERFIGLDQVDLVFFGDAGDAWLTGDGPGRVPNNRLPVLREWNTDVGIGVDAGEIGLYLAKGLSKSESVKLIARLQRRF